MAELTPDEQHIFNQLTSYTECAECHKVRDCTYCYFTPCVNTNHDLDLCYVCLPLHYAIHEMRGNKALSDRVITGDFKWVEICLRKHGAKRG